MIISDSSLLYLILMPLIEKYISDGVDVDMQTWLYNNNINIKIIWNDDYHGDSKYIKEIELPDNIEDRMQLILTYI